MNKKPSENLYNQIIKEDIDYINNLIKDKVVENYYLEFKSVEEIDYTGKRKLFNSDKKNYAKSISAFGNTDGGVIIWGIKTGASDADYASEKLPIKNISNFKSLLEGFTSLVTSPPHPNVTNTIIFEDKSQDTGYIITHIPKSSQRPLQVVSDNEFRYYIRAGSSSLPASDTFLRSLFGKEPQPDTFIAWGVSPVKIDEFGAIKIDAGLMLHNRGENISRNVNGYLHIGGLGLAIEVNRNYQNDFSYYTNNINGMKVGFTAKPHFVLGVEHEIQPLLLHIEIKKPITPNGIQIYALVNGDNQMSHKITINVSKEELENAYDSYIKDNNFELLKVIFKNEDKELLDS